MNNTIELLDQPEQCVHCGKRFRLAKTLTSHMCEPKRRHLQRTEKRVQAGFWAFNRFFQLTQNGKSKTYEEFSSSPFYNAFVKFGSYLNNVDVLYPEKFLEYLVREAVKLDHWCRDAIYYAYLYKMLRQEPTESAIQRTILTMMDWADESNQPYTSYFSRASSNKLVQDIMNGKVSAWVLLNVKSGKRMLQNLSDDQLQLITPALDMKYWLHRFQERPSDVVLVQEVCQDAGIE
jgi:hypothetical protein